MPKGKRNTSNNKEAKTYNHSEETPQRPDIGTEAQFKKKKPPVTYRYDSSLAPELNWDDNPSREQAEALIQQILTANDLETAQIAANKLKKLSQPFLNWTGKAERLSFDVPTLPLFVHERLSTRAIIETLKSHQSQPEQLSLFSDPQWSITDQILKAYEYKDKWVNRMILGDSLVTMNSLLQYEGMGGQVQMIYIDPPYGVKFGSNFQPFVRKRDVKHNDDNDLTREPETVKAYRDTWELGLHSYLSYLRDRLLLARELLTESGSVFVQISDENVHHVRELMDEVFGSENFVSLITFSKTASTATNLISSECDYILWFAKNISSIKYRQIYLQKTLGTFKSYKYLINTDDMSLRYLTKEEKENPYIIPQNCKIVQLSFIVSQDSGRPEERFYKFQGILYDCGSNRHWKTSNPEGLDRLAKSKRLIGLGKQLNYIRYLDDFPVTPITNFWNDTGSAGYSNSDPKIYVVQTDVNVIQRCLLMTTDPGDLVLDITCLRKGTKVLIPHQPTHSSSLNTQPTHSPPLKGGQGGVNSQKQGFNPPNPPVNGGALENSPVNRGALENSPVNGGALENSPVNGGALEAVETIEIENLKPGDYVIGKDGKPHRVIRTISKTHQGKMIGIRHQLCQQTLWVTGDHRILCQKRTTSYGGDRSWEHIPKDNFGLARDMRKEQTPAETKLWQAIRGNQLGVKFRRQHPIGRYITDFYNREKGCIIEVDGDSHYTPEAIIYDQERDAYLTSLGLTVLRFNNQEIYDNLEGVIETIQATLNAVEPSEAHYQEWRRADSLKIGDLVYFGIEQIPCEIIYLDSEITTETVYDLEVETVHSFITEICTVHNCGSGTTAYVAEQWGRRWITCDVSRVPLALARQRLLTATFPWYELKDGNSPSGGFVYKRKQNKKGEEIGGIVPHITLKSIANNEQPEEEILVDRPETDNSIVRVCSPFTIEGTIPPPVDMEGEEKPESQTVEVDSTASFTDRMLEVLRQSPILHLPDNKTVEFTNVRQPARSQNIHAEALVKASVLGDVTLREAVDEVIEQNQKLLPLSQKPVAFLFGSENGAISVCGLPDIKVNQLDDGKYQVELLGLDVFDPVTMLVDHEQGNNVPAWFLDTDYNGLCFYVRQAFFPRTSAWNSIKTALKGSYDDEVWEHLAGTTSAPFEKGEYQEIAVKVIDDRGNELLVVKELPKTKK